MSDDQSRGGDSGAPRQGYVANEALAEVLDANSAVGTLWQAEGGRVRCVACGHRCLLGEGRRGICKVRFNLGGRLRVPFGYVAALQCDPVEKKPFFHLLPGREALTFGMLGCDLHCPYCQNWVSSQALRLEGGHAPIQRVSARQVADAARKAGARLVVSSYNEPLITAEWAAAVFAQAKTQGLLCAVVSNGNATVEALDLLRPWIAAYKVDLKGFDAQRYRRLGGTLEHVKESIGLLHARGIWLEVLTLVVPWFNDTESELRAIARFIAGISRDIPWHVTAFHPDYRMTDPRRTTAGDLVRAAELGAAEGLRFVYAGNLPGQVGEWENTRCPRCGHTVIERFGFVIRSCDLTAAGRCPKCDQAVPGIWQHRARDGMTNDQ
jgi:pyruvate formate lyase activating enzyme